MNWSLLLRTLYGLAAAWNLILAVLAWHQGAGSSTVQDKAVIAVLFTALLFSQKSLDVWRGLARQEMHR